MGDPGHRRVIPPEQNAAGILQIRHTVGGKPDPKRILVGQVTTPTAKLHRNGMIGAAKCPSQATDPVHRIRQRGGGGRGVVEGDGFGTILVRQLRQFFRHRVECFIPTDPLPTGIGIALRPRPFHRVKQPVGMIDKLRRNPSFDAERLAGWM